MPYPSKSMTATACRNSSEPLPIQRQSRAHPQIGLGGMALIRGRINGRCKLENGSWRQAAQATKYVVIGPSGWIGNALLSWLGKSIGEEWRSKTKCYGSSARMIVGPDNQPLEVLALADLLQADLSGAVVFHLAYLTKEKAAELSDGEFFSRNQAIDQLVLDAITASMPKAIFVASSGAAADAQSGKGRNLYGVTKLLQEDRFLAYAAKSGLPTFVGRIFNIAGPYINKFDHYAVSSFAQQAILSGQINVTASIPVFRSFLGVIDLIELVTAELLTGAPDLVPIDLCGHELLEMGQIAATVAHETAGLTKKPVVPIFRPKIDFSRTSSYFGDPRPALQLALKHDISLMPFPVQVRETIAYMRTVL